MTTNRYEARYREGYYVVVDAETGAVVPPSSGHYQRYHDGYLWCNTAVNIAHAYNTVGLTPYNSGAFEEQGS